jgi:hypothetical protein
MERRKETVHDKVGKQEEDLEVRTIHQLFVRGERIVCFNIVPVEVRFATACNQNNTPCIV